MLILDYFGVRYDSPTFRHLVMTRDARKGKYRSYTDDDYDKKSFHIFNSFFYIKRNVPIFLLLDVTLLSASSTSTRRPMPS